MFAFSLPSFFTFQGKEQHQKLRNEASTIIYPHKIIPYFIHYITSKYTRNNYFFFYNSSCEASQTYTILNSDFGPAIQQLRPAPFNIILVSFSHYHHLSNSLNVCFLRKQRDGYDYNITQDEFTNIGRDPKNANRLYKKDGKHNKLYDNLPVRWRLCQHEELVWPFMFLEICFMNHEIDYRMVYRNICDWKKTDFDSYTLFVENYFDILCSIDCVYCSTFENRFPRFFHHFMFHRPYPSIAPKECQAEDMELDTPSEPPPTEPQTQSNPSCEIFLGREGTGYVIFDDFRIERYNPMLVKILERKGCVCIVRDAVRYDHNESDC